MKNLFLIILIVVSIMFAPKTYAAEISAGTSAELKTLLEKEEDIRVKILKDFLQKYNSPLVENAQDFVRSADLYNLDWRLVASISGVESTFGKYIPYNSYNAWGWGVYGNNVIYFSSWAEGIETISKGLRDDYMDKGAYDLYQIGRIYAESPNWASRVSYFMQGIDKFKSQSIVSNLPISL